METSTESPTKEYHQVLQKFINVALFGKIRNPNFNKNKEGVELQHKLLDFYQLLESQSIEERKETISTFYDKILIDFHKILKDKNLIDLMNCYGFSNFRVIINLFRMLGTGNSKTIFDPHKNDSNILSELIMGSQFPDEIHSYLCMQFFDLFNHIPQKQPVITEEQYQFLIDRYVGEYEY